MPADLDIRPLTPRAIPGSGGALRAGRRSQVVLVLVLSDPRRRLQRRQRRATSQGARDGHGGHRPRRPGAGSGRLSRWCRRRLGERRAAWGLRTAGPFARARPGRRQAGLVDRLLRRRSSGTWSRGRNGAARCRDRLRPGPRSDDARGLPDRAGRRASAPTRTSCIRARCRCSRRPDSASSRGAGRPRRPRHDRSSAARSGGAGPRGDAPADRLVRHPSRAVQVIRPH